MARYVTIDTGEIGGTVDGVAEWDGVTPWPESGRAVQSDTAQVGDTWDGGSSFSGPVVAQDDPFASLSDAEVKALAVDDATMKGMDNLAEWLRRQP